MLQRPFPNISGWTFALLFATPILLFALTTFTVGKTFVACVKMAPTNEWVRWRQLGRFEPAATVTLDEHVREHTAYGLADECGSSATVGEALTYIGRADALESALNAGWVRHQSSRHDTDGDEYESARNAYVSAVANLSPAEEERLENSTGIPRDMWLTCLYLNRQIKHAIPPLSSLTSREAYERLARRPSVEVMSDGAVELHVRHRDPRAAEVLASAIGATVQHNFRNRLAQAAESSLARSREREAEARADLQRASDTFDALTSGGRSRPKGWAMAEAQLRLAQDAWRQAAMYRRTSETAAEEISEDGAVTVQHWAGNRGEKDGRTEIPAFPRPASRPLAAATMAGSMFGIALAAFANWLAPALPRRYRTPPAVPEPPTPDDDNRDF